MRTVPWPEPGARERIDHRSLSDRAEEAREAGDLEQAAELEPGAGEDTWGQAAAIEAKFWQGEGESPSSALAEAGESRGPQRPMGEPDGSR